MGVFDDSGTEIMRPAATTINNELEEKIIPLGEIFIGGDAIEKCKDVFKSPNIRFVENVFCSAALLVTLSEQKFLSSSFESVAYFQPIYLRESYAKPPGK
jgi:tRNA threonylcarbamoyladenosine biosynthesis protein TsaB